jgi:hypothetical protein
MTKLNKNILTIDTTDFGKVTFSLIKSHPEGNEGFKYRLGKKRQGFRVS